MNTFCILTQIKITNFIVLSFEPNLNFYVIHNVNDINFWI